MNAILRVNSSTSEAFWSFGLRKVHFSQCNVTVAQNRHNDYQKIPPLFHHIINFKSPSLCDTNMTKLLFVLNSPQKGTCIETTKWRLNTSFYISIGDSEAINIVLGLWNFNIFVIFGTRFTMLLTGSLDTIRSSMLAEYVSRGVFNLKTKKILVIRRITSSKSHWRIETHLNVV